MELREGVSVYTPGGEQVGKVNRFVLDPATNELTHIVIQQGWLLPEDKVVPFDMVSTVTGDKVVLNEEVGAFDQLPAFEEEHYVRAADDDPVNSNLDSVPRDQYAPAYYWYPTQLDRGMGFPGVARAPYVELSTETHRNIPEDTVPLKEGTEIVSSDGKHVGDVERLFVQTDSNKVTHFLISQGILFKDRKLVPAHWVKTVDEDRVSLVVSSELLERLPSYQE